MNGGISRNFSLIYELVRQFCATSQPHPVIVRACAHTYYLVVMHFQVLFIIYGISTGPVEKIMVTQIFL